MSSNSSTEVRQAAELMELHARIKMQQTRIEALETALQKLTEDPPATLDEPDPDFVVINKMRKIARAALDKDTEQ